MMLCTSDFLRDSCPLGLCVLCTVVLPGVVKIWPLEGGGNVHPQLQVVPQLQAQGREQLTSAEESQLDTATPFPVLWVLGGTPSFSLSGYIRDES